MLSVYSTYVTAIFLEGIFFLTIGVIISSLIDVFISDNTISKIVPSGRVTGIAVSSLTGILFPVCECGIVPVVAGLIKKGLPVSHAVTMLLSIPVVNLVTFTSTYYAFPGTPVIAFLRMAGGVAVSFCLGLAVSLFLDDDSVLKRKPEEKKYKPVNLENFVILDHLCSPGCSCHHHVETHSKLTPAEKIRGVLNHSVGEFFETGRYFIIGILVTAAFQTFVPKNAFDGVSSAFPLPELFMTGYAYILSICSQTDAFVARSMSSYFGPGALLCFMISGAMIDVKTTLMLRVIFRKRFIILLAAGIIISTVCFSFLAETVLKIL
jgi:hypothetical protein